jgi:hypothetical protein
MSLPLPEVPPTAKVSEGATRISEDRNQINMVWTGPTQPPHLLNRVWIRPA